MKLSSLLPTLPAYEIENERDVKIAQVTADSRQVQPGALFVAYPGVSVDGARFISHALERGAVAIVAEKRPPAPLPCPLVLVPNARIALAHLAAAWHDFPSRKLRVIGVTGTDGKTTTCTLVAAILTAAGHQVGAITTVGATIGGNQVDTGLHTTTPDAPDIQFFLAQMVDARMQYAVVEATSEGLAQRRLDAIDFDVAAVTNITHEHLYYHGNWENYRDAKALLFRSLAASFRKPRTRKVAVLNADDHERGAFEFLSGIPADEQIVYQVERQKGNGKREPTEGKRVWIYGRDIQSAPSGLRFVVETPFGELEVQSPLIGRFNVSNILAAVGIGIARRVPFEAIRKGIALVKGVPGRMEIIQAEPFMAIVDFAHTPNALRVALETARELTRGRLIVAFGCAGLRDVEKRALMGEVAGKLADYVVVTAEDPRTESLDAINGQISEGLGRVGRRRGSDYEIVPDRSDAIAAAVGLAHPGDLVISCGKGHERSMCIGTTEYPWNEQEEVRRALKPK